MRAFLPRGIRPYKIRRGPLRGRAIVTSLHDYPGAILGYTESDLLRWIGANVRKGETWLDIGAHYGYTALALAERVGSTGRIFAFEPVLTTVGHLSITKSLNGLDWITVVPFGLESSSGLRVVTVPAERGMAQHLARGGATTQICLVCFDEIWQSLSGNQPAVHGVKVDVQGAEHDVIAGMRGHLVEWRPRLVIEFHHGVDRERFMDLLVSIGYARSGACVDGAAHGPPYLDDRSYIFDPAS